MTSNMTSMTFYEATLQFPEASLQYDAYSGIALHVQHLKGILSQSPLDFQKVLESSLHKWKKEKRRGIWIHIPKSHAHLIQPSLAAGFDFHFCESSTLILKQWLPNTSSRLPLGPTHQVGVGALVLEGGKMLVVQERSGPAAGRKDTFPCHLVICVAITNILSHTFFLVECSSQTVENANWLVGSRRRRWRGSDTGTQGGDGPRCDFGTSLVHTTGSHS
jgi:Nudix hydrolase domain